MKRISLLVILFLAIDGTTGIAAQAIATGTAVLRMKTQLPPTAAAEAGSAELDIQMTAWSDGHQVAMEMVMGGLGPAGGMVTRTIFTLGGDTVHFAMISPKLAVATGSPGMRMDLPLSSLGAANPILGGLMDSLSKVASTATFRSLGTTAVVAGITCAEWEMVAGGDTTRSCVVPTPPELLALQQAMAKMPGVGSLLAGLGAEIQRKAFDGKPMAALRTTSAKVSMELVSVVPGVPDRSVFQLPTGLKVMGAP